MSTLYDVLMKTGFVLRLSGGWKLARPGLCCFLDELDVVERTERIEGDGEPDLLLPEFGWMKFPN